MKRILQCSILFFRQYRNSQPAPNYTFCQPLPLYHSLLLFFLSIHFRWYLPWPSLSCNSNDLKLDLNEDLALSENRKSSLSFPGETAGEEWQCWNIRSLSPLILFYASSPAKDEKRVRHLNKSSSADHRDRSKSIMKPLHQPLLTTHTRLWLHFSSLLLTPLPPFAHRHSHTENRHTLI